VVPDARRFAIATKADDAEFPEHLWDLRALRLDGTLNTQEGNALTLLRKVLLQRWRRITTRSFLVYLNLEKITHGIVKQKGKIWMVNVRKIYLHYLVAWLSPGWKPRYGDWKRLCSTYL
jgi:hypothetical protein